MYIKFTVNGGDEIEANIVRYSTGFQFAVADLTTNKSYSYFETTSLGDGTTAEAILERPRNSIGNYLSPLTQFGSPDEYYLVTPDGNSLNSYSHAAVYMVSSATLHELAHVGGVFSSQDFYDYYDNCG